MEEQPLSGRGFVVGGAIILALCLSILPVSAHHGWGGYLDEDFQLSGTVESPVSLAGPHATMKIRAEN